ncbi:hypothetical protein [Streptosporangium sp. NPDC000396]|uniref:hypothetical protein n=1 Tax=Streptosporangium sp. NPDC000396 TaxID=3366185 RepID=UPI00368E9219
MDPVAVMRAARTIRDELDSLLGDSSGELRDRLDPLLAEEGGQAPGPLADAVVMLIAQYGPAWERFTLLLRSNDQATAGESAPPSTGQSGPDLPAPGSTGPHSLPPGPAGPAPSDSASPDSSSSGSTNPSWPPPGQTGPDWPRLDDPATVALKHEPQPEPPPARPARDRGPSVIGRLTGAFRRRRVEHVEQAPAGPEPEVFPLIEVPDEVVAGREAEMEIGLSPGEIPGAPAASPAPEPVDLDIQIVAEGFEAPGGWRVRLRVGEASPYPRATLRLFPLPQDQPVTARQIQAIHVVRGQVTGFGVRALAVLDSPGLLGQEAAPQPVAGTRVRLADAGEPADVTAVIVHGDRPGRLWWTYQSPHFTTPDRAEICDLGMRTSEFGRQLAGQAQNLQDMGRRIASTIPRGFWELLNAVAGRVAPRRPSVLILSQEPHVPWELAALERPFDSSIPGFLNCQAVTGRWPLGGRRPELPPPARTGGDSMAVVYGGAEVHPLVTAFGATRVSPVLGDVLAMFAEPPDMIHFTAGSTVSEALGRGMGAGSFVFLEEPADCQAFLLAGASGVVAPLWPVGDGLAPEFYRRCSAGEPPAEVLRSLRCQAPATASAYQFFGHPSLTLSRAQSRA